MGRAGERRRVAAAPLAAAVALLLPLPVRAQPAAVGFVPRFAAGCAGDGVPLGLVEPSTLLAAEWVAAAGADARLSRNDAADADTHFAFRAVRVALCGRVPTRHGTLLYQLGYEPWSVVERATPDHASWGRLLAAELGFRPWRWLTVAVGVRKLVFAFGHDEPEQLLALPVRPAIAVSLAPDRRLGASLDADLGTILVTLGVYEGARDLAPTGDGGVLVVGHLTAEPIGPVGPTVSTLGDPPAWRRRPRVALDASALIEYVAGQTGYALGAALPFKWGPVGAAVEYLFGSNTVEQGPAGGPRRDRQGVWAQTAVMLWRPHVELEARYEWLSESSVLLAEIGSGVDRRAFVPSQHWQAITVGATGYAVGATLKLQLAYTHKFSLVPNYDDDVALLVLTAAY
jgi:hypothetical protein